MPLLIFLFNIMDGHELKKKLGDVVLRTGIMRRKAEDDGTKTSLTRSPPCLGLSNSLPDLRKIHLDYLLQI